MNMALQGRKGITYGGVISLVVGGLLREAMPKEISMRRKTSV
jgi:hypothetical protein